MTGRITTNTLLLYLRLVVSFGVSLVVTPVVLSQLGESDYGTFHVVGGLVGLLSFLPGAMASATQRFFADALGRDDTRHLRESFSVNLGLYLILTGIALLVLETAGLYFLSHVVHVPAARLPVALLLYQLSVAGFVVSLLAAPYMAMIIAHEDMHIYARMAFVDALLRLAAAAALFASPADKLLCYGALSTGCATVTVLLYVMICLRAYPECRLRSLTWNSSLATHIVGFTGWALFGQLSTVCRMQAITILLNQYFNPATVAARAIAMSITQSVGLLSSNLNTSLYGPIIKCYAANDRQRMFELLYHGCKATFFLMWLLALPLLIEVDGVLALWLKRPPAVAGLFSQLALAESLILAISLPLLTAARAPGKMALYEGSLGTIQFMIFATAWVGIACGAPAAWVFITAIAGNAVMFAVRVVLLRGSLGLPIMEFTRRVTWPVLAVVAVTLAVAVGMRHLLLSMSLPLVARVVVMAGITAAVICTLGLDRSVRSAIYQMIATRARKITAAYSSPISQPRAGRR
jgi:O-antigen/teichoic acid export membrane protein